MSPRRKGGGYNPGAGLSLADLQAYWDFFKRVNENPIIVPAVIAAGVSGVLEILHMAWLAARYIWKF